MQQQALVYSFTKLERDKIQEPVLLQTGHHDEALRYFAPVVKINSHEYLAYFGESSKLLDLVRLKRKVLVQADFGEKNIFDAELSLAAMPKITSSQSALLLTLISLCKEQDLVNKICPVT